MQNMEPNPIFVAVVDDEQDLVCLFRDALSQVSGVQVFGFTEPMLALQHFKVNQSNYRIIISDYRMPAMNGIELLSRIKEVNPSVVRVLMSAFEIEDKIFKQFNCVDKFLQKPIRISDLIKEIQRQLKSTQIKKEVTIT
jgi:response regulator RpfG family c-di-GMP phosphodiesterase